jgi:hypothetical protein
MLSEAAIQRFIEKGFVRLDNAFPRELADQGRELLWRETGCDPDDPLTWTQPVIRLGDYQQAPFRQAVNTPRLHAAFDQLVGMGRWLPRKGLGTFPVRFPAGEAPKDDGWHADASFAGEDERDYLSWRINVHSRGRALLMLFLFSDVGEQDAPTRVLAGSHLKVARLLEPFGEAGLSFMELAGKLDQLTDGPAESAVGQAGTVYLCHPFLVHAAQAHRGVQPRFMAQPPLVPAQPFQLYRQNDQYSPVEQAIRLALAMEKSNPAKG